MKEYNRLIKHWIVRMTCIVLLLCLLAGCGSRGTDSAIGPVPLDIGAWEFCAANYKQFASYIKLGMDDGELYMWNGRECTLSQFENGAFRKVCRIDGGWIGIFDGYFYYEAAVKGEEYTYSVSSYHLETGEHRSLTTVGIYSIMDTFFTEDGKLYVPADGDRTSYKVIGESEYLEEVRQYETYTIGEYSYVLEGKREQADLIRYDAEGNRYSLEDEVPYGEKSMIPCENGLLIHNETNGDFLYFVEAETGNVVELFTVECIYASSAVNVHDGYAYLSFVRYTEWGPLGIGGKRDETDELNGTYRISLEDYSVEKISDEIYNGLYIFDDTGIYACNADYQVFKLDFDGYVTAQLTQ